MKVNLENKMEEQENGKIISKVKLNLTPNGHYVDSDNNIWDMYHKIIIGKRTFEDGIDKVCLGDCLEQCCAEEGYYHKSEDHLCDLYPCRGCKHLYPYWLATLKGTCVSCDFHNFCADPAQYETNNPQRIQTGDECDLCGVFLHHFEQTSQWDRSLLCGHIFCEDCVLKVVSESGHQMRKYTMNKIEIEDNPCSVITEHGEDFFVEYVYEYNEDDLITIGPCYRRNSKIHEECQVCDERCEETNESWTEICAGKLYKCPIKYCASPFILLENHRYINEEYSDAVGSLFEDCWANDPNQLPDIIPHMRKIKDIEAWTKEIHKCLNERVRQEIFELYKIWSLRSDRVHNIPKDILFLIFTHIAKFHKLKQCKQCKKDNEYLDKDDVCYLCRASIKVI